MNKLTFKEKAPIQYKLLNSLGFQEWTNGINSDIIYRFKVTKEKSYYVEYKSNMFWIYCVWIKGIGKIVLDSNNNLTDLLKRNFLKTKKLT